MRYRMLTLCLFLLAALPCFASPVYLSGYQVTPSADKTRLLFTLSSQTAGKVKYQPNPHRLIVEFANTIKLSSLKTPETFKTELLPNQGLRFVFAVPAAVTWTTRYVPASAGNTVQLEIVLTSKAPLPAKAHTPAVASLKKKIQHDLLSNFLASLPDEAVPTIGRSRLETPTQKTRQQKNRTLVVVIDAGHGGKDPGAHGQHGTKEKDVVLRIAKRLADDINRLPHLRAVLTRTGDYYLPLRERLRIARKQNADLFIAIHADAYFNKQATGASVYALSQHGATSEAARWLAQRDNYSELGEVELSALKDRSLMLRSVMIDLAQTTTIQDSIKLGNKMLDTLDRLSTLHHTHVEQAPFMVLKSPDIPSVLVETGFITNPHEEKRLATAAYQSQVAEALLTAIKRYVKQDASWRE